MLASSSSRHKVYTVTENSLFLAETIASIRQRFSGRVTQLVCCVCVLVCPDDNFERAICRRTCVPVTHVRRQSLRVRHRLYLVRT